MKLLIKNGYVVDPVNSVKGISDLYIADSKISAPFPAPYDRIIDAAGKYVLPGLVDAHCHLRDPGYEYREDIASGTASAVSGGFTSVACMPNTKPVCDNAAVVEYIKTKARRTGKCNVFPIGAVSKGQDGLELAEIGLMASEGIVAVSDDGRPVGSSGLMMKAMKYASDFGLTVISHCEDLSLADGGHMNEGQISTMLGLRGIPSIAEEIMASRDILISSYTGLPVHIAHVSTKGSVDMIRNAKDKGIKVTCETCPHYFTLTEKACLGFDTMAKINPPLRTDEDISAIIEGLKDGTIDMIVTDHAPHHTDEKDKEFADANYGITGFETAFALSFTYLVREAGLPVSKLVSLMSVNPSDFLKLGRGNLRADRPADVSIFDVENEFVFDKRISASKARNTPFDGWKLYGKTCMTIVGGNIAYEKLC